MVQRATGLAARSVELIREHQTSAGAYIAGPTFPTYRYCWFRDGAYIAYAMDLVGEHDSADRFFAWATSMITTRAESIERAITVTAVRQAPSPEDRLDTRYTSDGRGSADEWPSFQLDGFGTLLWALEHHLVVTSEPLSQRARYAVDLLARYVAALWRYPCYDCWEEFGDNIHASTLAALGGGLKAAARLMNNRRHAETASTITDFIRANLIADDHFAKFVGNPQVDASLLHLSTPYRLVDPGDPVMVRTMERIIADLLSAGGGLHRYATDTYYGGGEWILLTAYLGWHELERGNHLAARDHLVWIERQATWDGLLPEQVSHHLNDRAMFAVWEERWGPSACPLLWSHAAYLTLHTELERRTRSGA